MTTDEEYPEILWSDAYAPDWDTCETCGHYSQVTVTYYSDGSVEWRDEISCTSWEFFDGPPEGFFEWFKKTYSALDAPELTEMRDGFKGWLEAQDD